MVQFVRLEEKAKVGMRTSFFAPHEQGGRTNLKKSIHGAPNLMSEQCDVDGMVRARLVAG